MCARRRGAGGRGREIRHVRNRPRHSAGADRAVRRGAHRHRAHAPARAHRLPVRRPRGGAHRAGRHGLRRRGRARGGARAGARRDRPLRAAARTRRSSGCCSRAAPCRAINCSTSRPMRSRPACAGRRARRASRLPGKAQTELDDLKHEPCGPSCGRDLERHRAGRAHRILRVAQSRAHAGARRHSGLPPRAALYREIRHAGILHALRGGLRRSAGRAGLSQPAEQSDAVDAARAADLLPRHLARHLPREALARGRAGRLDADAALRRRGRARGGAGAASAPRRAAAARRHRAW